jgi:hypothetical protein
MRRLTAPTRPNQTTSKEVIRERLDSQIGVCPLWAGGTWTVSLKHDGTYGCSCPAWKFAKAPNPDCHHIELIKINPLYDEQSNKRIVRANVREVTPGENDVLLTPLVPFGDLDFSLTVACDLARLGGSPEDIAKYLHGNRIRVAQDYISQHGRKIYGPWSERRARHDGYAVVPWTTASGR